MSALFIAGNGFDIAHGIPSKYSDFRNFIIKMFPDALRHRDDLIYPDYIKSVDKRELAAEILLSAMDKVAGKDWANFEEALALIDFNAKFPLPNHKENETDAEDQQLMMQYLLYTSHIADIFVTCSKLWQEYFQLWIRCIQDEIDCNTFTAHDSLSQLFSQEDIRFFTFNYTKTLQKLYGVKQVTHVHNRVGQNLIYGHGLDDVTYNQFNHDFSNGIFFGSSALDEMVTAFKKDTDRQMKKYEKFFKSLDSSVDKVYSYGFSYGKVDQIYIKTIINKISPNAIWHFTEHESKNSEVLRRKKIKLRRYGFKGTFKLFEG